MLTMTDLFCGGGGSTSGAKNVPGIRVAMAANHAARDLVAAVVEALEGTVQMDNRVLELAAA